MAETETKTKSEGTTSLHVAMFPWLAVGHFIPFLRLADLLAQRGHKISFLSTPHNLSRLPKISPHLSSLITLVPLPFPETPSLPPLAQSSSDVPNRHQQLLKPAFDALLPALRSFLESSRPDWVLYDYASHWLPALAAELRVPHAFLSLFAAVVLSFFGPPPELVSGRRFQSDGGGDLTAVPPWAPAGSGLAFRPHEVARNAERSEVSVETTPDTVRFGVSIGESDAVVVRTCEEFEPEWLGLLRELYGDKPVLPVGFLPPMDEEDESDDVESTERWRFMKSWLDGQETNSVVYVAFGTEVTLTRAELVELARGLELSGLPFFWVLRRSPGSDRDDGLESLPCGFLERVRGRGFVHSGWAPQVKILRHESIGGFFTHCGYNSMIEGLSCGRILVLFPVMNEQGLNARLLLAKGVAIEVPRDKMDGSFTGESVAGSVRLAMVDEAGKPVRAAAREMKGVFGNREKNDGYVDEFVRYLAEHRKPKPAMK
ncbi:UDP-glycosyltransferase 91C1-like [Rhodamnia argentea]|uniref:UDP-glycosyltransferase 91C1-like n=1 Tax=Rhodamnia argentea TaxID=178133 RepID=A0A8B8P193_9MYRT|nr:UDP-glycosyltransferase 91C1-like [Rhodamnia argentea]